MNIKQSFRIISRNKTYSILNIFGLAIGLAVVLLICLLIYNERSFDQSFKQKGNIYRMNSNITQFMNAGTYCGTATAVGPAMQEAIPEVLTTVRTLVQSYTMKVDDKLFKIDRFCWADEDFFKLFDTPFVHGTSETALSKPNTIAISEKMAAKLFGFSSIDGDSFSWILRKVEPCHGA